MRGNDILAPQPGSLHDSEPVLLVDHGEAEVAETDIVFDDGMGADKYVERAVGQSGRDFLSFLFPGGACEQADIHT